MTNSDYLIKAAVKKLSDRLSKTFSEKIEEATAAAQGAPDIIKKELDNLKEEIIQEAIRMEKEKNNEDEIYDKDIQEPNIINKISQKINQINYQLEILNKNLDT